MNAFFSGMTSTHKVIVAGIAAGTLLGFGGIGLALSLHGKKIHARFGNSLVSVE